MKTLFRTFAPFWVLFIFIGCDTKEDLSEEDFKIEFGSVCGWCAGDEFISVTNSRIEYYRYIPCGDNKGTTMKNRKISGSEWNEIITSFDYQTFKSLNHNTCNVCVDGCDEIIRITDNGMANEIRYSPGDEILETKNIKLILAELLVEMRTAN